MPWGFITGLLPGSNEKIDVKVLYKWKLLFSVKGRELFNNVDRQGRTVEDCYYNLI